MITIISPAKTMNFNAIVSSVNVSTAPIFEDEVGEIINICKNLEHKDIKQLMSVSDKLVDMNYDRFQKFFDTKTPQKQALFAYNGDVYNGIKTQSFTKKDAAFAQNSIRIISGLYGVLRPMDLIRPYRLEMSANLKNNLGKNLYSFWRGKITQYFNEELKIDTSQTLVNLASKEYSSVIDRRDFSGQIIDIVFKEKRNGETRVVSINSKRARGVMANFIIKEKVDNAGLLKDYQEDGYKFDKISSSDSEFFFVKSL